MSRSRKPQRRVRKPVSLQVKLEALEDRRVPGSILELPGSPWAQLSFGQLQGPSSGQLQIQLLNEPAIQSTHASPGIVLQPSSGAEDLPFLGVAEPILVRLWSGDPLADLSVFPDAEGPRAMRQGPELVGLPNDAPASEHGATSFSQLREGATSGSASLLASRQLLDQTLLEGLAAFAVPPWAPGQTWFTPFVPATEPAAAIHSKGSTGLGSQAPGGVGSETSEGGDIRIDREWVLDPAVPIEDCECNSIGQPIGRPPIGGGIDRLPPGISRGSGVRFYDGLARVGGPSVVSNGFGKSWGHSTMSTNSDAFAPRMIAGKGVGLGWLPYIEQKLAYSKVVVVTCTQAHHFVRWTPSAGPKRGWYLL